jgi:hypothetical protein
MRRIKTLLDIVMLNPCHWMILEVTYLFQEGSENVFDVDSDFLFMLTVMILDEVLQLKSSAIHNSNFLDLVIVDVSIMEHAYLEVLYWLVDLVEILTRIMKFMLPSALRRLHEDHTIHQGTCRDRSQSLLCSEWSMHPFDRYCYR